VPWIFAQGLECGDLPLLETGEDRLAKLQGLRIAGPGGFTRGPPEPRIGRWLALPLFFAVSAVGSRIHAGKCNILQRCMRTIKTTDQTPPILCKAENLAEAFEMSLQQIWRLQRQGRIPCVRLGRRTLRFNLGEVAAALEAQTRPSVFTTGRIQ